jgi:hypothetical protein
MAWVLHEHNRVHYPVGDAAERQVAGPGMVPGVLEPAGSASMALVRDVVTFRPIRFPSDVSHTPPLRAACSLYPYPVDAECMVR